jgi:hypothetical protein
MYLALIRFSFISFLLFRLLVGGVTVGSIAFLAFGLFFLLGSFKNLKYFESNLIEDFKMPD